MPTPSLEVLAERVESLRREMERRDADHAREIAELRAIWNRIVWLVATGVAGTLLAQIGLN